MDQTFFHVAFVVIFLAFTMVRATYRTRAAPSRRRAESSGAILTNAALRLVVQLVLSIGLVVYVVRPSWFAWAQFPLPAWVQWAGLALGIATVPVMWWTQRTLAGGSALTPPFQSAPALVTDGPYRWVRHPMYTVLYLHFLALLLLTRSWLVGGLFLAVQTLIVAARLKREEATLLDTFGDAYRQYASQTGRFVPGLKLL